MNNEKERTPNEILNDLYSFTYGNEDTEDISPEKALKRAEASGVNLDKLLRFVEEQATVQRKQSRLKKAKLKRQQLINSTTTKISEVTANIRDEVLGLIKGLEASQPQQATVYFNRFKECSDEDLQSLKEDLLMLQNIENNNANKKS